MLSEAMIVMLAFVVIIFGGVYTLRVISAAKKLKHYEAMPPSKTAVSAQAAQSLTWHPSLSAIASLEAAEGVEVTSEAGGLVKEITFSSGNKVQQGQLLVQLDISQDKAQLQGLEAQAKLDRINLHRQSTLYKRKVASKSALDQANAQYEQSRANVAAQKALIEKKTITAPFSGVVGIREVNLGQYISPGTQVVTLQALQPLYVDFSLPQQDLPKVKVGQSVHVTVDSYPGKSFRAKITAINPQVDTGTRNFKLQATLANKKKLLRPGMFGHAEVELPARNNVVTLPQAAISYNPYGDTVYLVTRNGKPVMGLPGKKTGKNARGQAGQAKSGQQAPLKVSQVFVTLGPTRGDQVEIEKGIKPGELVVTSGQLKLKNGALIKINNSLKPSNNPNPNPPEE